LALNPREWLKALAAVDRLLDLEETLTATIDKHTAEIEQLKERITRLEAREEVIIAEAKGAAGAAASVLMAELARRIGVLEERTTQARRLPPPE
jgi:recombinational DNA repair protein RecR